MYRLDLTLLVLSIAACTVGEEHHHDDSVLDLSSALLVKTRDRLAVCLQLDPLLADQAPALTATLDADLARLGSSHPDWQIAGLDRGVIEVAVGCPGNALATAVDGKGAAGAVLGPGVSAMPSRFRTHVHVITDARADAVLGDQAFGRAIAELAIVDEHRVAEVSTAIVVRASALGTEAFRTHALAQSVGLREVSP
ncbi:MAG TPA: hypothetical protein VIU61_30945 [Kofleriaceae bacterium]